MSRYVFLVGVQKGGTTSLHDLLSAHPEIDGSRTKEPGYFEKLRHAGVRRLVSGDIPYSETRCSTWEEYDALFTNDKAGWRLNSSTHYFQSMHALEQIKREQPDAQILICLREPVARAFSAYNWARKAGEEPAQSFEQALALENERTAQGYFFWYQYAGTSQYAAKVEAWLKAFEHTKIVLFEELTADAPSTANDIFQWLGLAPLSPEAFKASPKNPSGIDRDPLSRSLRRLTRSDPTGKSGTIRKMANGVLGERALKFMKTAIVAQLDKNLVSAPPLSDDTAARLAGEFRKGVEELEALIGRDLSAWKR